MGLRTFPPIEEALRQPTDLVLVVFPIRQIVEFLEGRCEYLCLGCGGPQAQTIQMSERAAARDRLFAFCRKAGVRRVLFSGYGRYESELELFRTAGFEVESLPVWPPNRIGYLEETERTALEVFRARFAEGKIRPDLIYFADDYIARGGLTALLSLGVRVPDEVRVVAYANKGFVPVFPVSLARIENDPVEIGAHTAEAVISKLEGRTSDVLPAKPRLVAGDSFPW